MKFPWGKLKKLRDALSIIGSILDAILGKKDVLDNVKEKVKKRKAKRREE